MMDVVVVLYLIIVEGFFCEGWFKVGVVVVIVVLSCF